MGGSGRLALAADELAGPLAAEPAALAVVLALTFGWRERLPVFLHATCLHFQVTSLVYMNITLKCNS